MGGFGYDVSLSSVSEEGDVKVRVKPPALKRGGTIMVIAPSSYPPYPLMKLSQGVDYLRKKGFKVILGRTLKEALRHRYFSAQDQVRAQELMEAFKNPDVDAVFCARGGIGSLRVINLLDYDVIKDNPKVFVGYSDITAYQMAFLEKAGLITFQGPMPAVYPKADGQDAEKIFRYNWDLLFRVIVEGRTPTLINPVDAPPIKTIYDGKAEGELTGGNLILFNLLQGTSFEPPTEGKILFLEDIEEEPWRVEEHLSSLILAEKLQKAKALVFGEFPEPQKFESPSPSIEEVLTETMARVGKKPSIMNLACCHGKYVLTMPVGARVRLDTDKGTLSLTDPAVEK